MAVCDSLCVREVVMECTRYSEHISMLEHSIDVYTTLLMWAMGLMGLMIVLVVSAPFINLYYYRQLKKKTKLMIYKLDESIQNDISIKKSDLEYSIGVSVAHANRLFNDLKDYNLYHHRVNSLISSNLDIFEKLKRYQDHTSFIYGRNKEFDKDILELMSKFIYSITDTFLHDSSICTRENADILRCHFENLLSKYDNVDVQIAVNLYLERTKDMK